MQNKYQHQSIKITYRNLVVTSWNKLEEWCRDLVELGRVTISVWPWQDEENQGVQRLDLYSHGMQEEDTWINRQKKLFFHGTRRFRNLSISNLYKVHQLYQLLPLSLFLFRFLGEIKLETAVMNQEHEREIGLLPKKWRKLQYSLKRLKFIEFHHGRSMIKSGRREKKGEIAKER